MRRTRFGRIGVLGLVSCGLIAGGVEAAASTAGVLTPPIMGAAAFIMAELLGIPYLKVAIAATKTAGNSSFFIVLPS